MKGECTIHGEVEIVRDSKGTLQCKVCEDAKFNEVEEKYKDTVVEEAASKLVDELFDPERMAKDKERRVEQFKEEFKKAYVREVKQRREKG